MAKQITHFTVRVADFDKGTLDIHVEAGDGEYVGDFIVDPKEIASADIGRRFAAIEIPMQIPSGTDAEAIVAGYVNNHKTKFDALTISVTDKPFSLGDVIADVKKSSKLY
jgi:hypothetical protein